MSRTNTAFLWMTVALVVVALVVVASYAQQSKIVEAETVTGCIEDAVRSGLAVPSLACPTF